LVQWNVRDSGLHWFPEKNWSNKTHETVIPKKYSLPLAKETAKPRFLGEFPLSEVSTWWAKDSM